MKESIWAKLTELEASEKFKRKSEQMRFANSCRRTKGRTGPIGEVGITERLRVRLGRYPHPDEIHQEMVRDKGYPGRTRNVSGGYQTKSGSDNVEGYTTGVSGSSVKPDTGHRSHSPMSNHTPTVADESTGNERVNGRESMAASEDEEEAVIEPNPLISLLLQQINDLKSSEYGDSDDVRVVVESLMKQVRSLQSKNLKSGTNSISEHESARNVPDDRTIAEQGNCKEPLLEQVCINW